MCIVMLDQNISFRLISINCHRWKMIKLEHYLGNGSFGTVYKVSIQGKLYALKKMELQIDQFGGQITLNEALNEVRLLSACTYHPNIVRYIHSSHTESTFYLLMEFAGYETLADLTLPIADMKRVTNILIQLCMGLRHLRKHGIVHRDIKMSNVMLSENGLIKIADFGISKQINIDKASTCVGTPYYTAPQIINRQKYDFAVDMWSLGVILYELTHGDLPFKGRSMEELKDKILKQTPTINKDLPPDIKEAIRLCLMKRPQHRATPERLLKLPTIRLQMLQEIEKC